jgi:hypothetical protein
MLVEGPIGEGDGVPAEELLLALAAAGMVAEACGRNPIEGLAAWADKDLGGAGHFKAK